MRRPADSAASYHRYALADGSAILLAGGYWWDIEGDRPWVCAGTGEELGAEGGDAEDED